MGDWLQDKCNEIQKAQQEHIQKSFGSEDIEKAQQANVGEIHTWNGKRYKKQPNGKWLQISDKDMTQTEHLRAALQSRRDGNQKDFEEHKVHAFSLRQKEYTDKEFEAKRAKVEQGGHKVGDIKELKGRRFKKQDNGKWLEISSEGKTAKEHFRASYEAMKNGNDKESKKHKNAWNELTTKEYKDKDFENK